MAIYIQQLKIKGILTPAWKVLGAGYIEGFILVSQDQTFWWDPPHVVISLKFSALGYL